MITLRNLLNAAALTGMAFRDTLVIEFMNFLLASGTRGASRVAGAATITVTARNRLHTPGSEVGTHFAGAVNRAAWLTGRQGNGE